MYLYLPLVVLVVLVALVVVVVVVSYVVVAIESPSNHQKVAPNTHVFWHFSLRNVLRPTTACTFSTSDNYRIVTKSSEPHVFCHFLLRNVLRATTACTFSTSERLKVVRTWCVLHIFTSKCASRHNGVHFFHIATPKSGSELTCFVHFYFEMRFAPQRRALFPQLNFQKSSENGVFCHFLLENVLRATAACTFSASQRRSTFGR